MTSDPHMSIHKGYETSAKPFMLGPIQVPDAPPTRRTDDEEPA